MILQTIALHNRFTAFVVEAVRVALENLEDDAEM